MSDSQGTSVRDRPRTDIDPEQAERDLAIGAATRRKKRLLDRIRDTLPQDTRNYAVAEVLDEHIEAVFKADGVTNEGGRPGIVGELLVSLSKFLESLGGSVMLRELDFSSSVRVRLEPIVKKSVRDRARDLAERDPEGVVTHDQLRELLPDSVAAANAAARLLAVPSQHAIDEARRYGADVPEAYIRLARVVSSTNGSVELRTPGRRDAKLASERATRIVAQLDEIKELEPQVLTIVGHLTRTDSEESSFRVVLDRDRMPPQLDARRRVVEGRYTARAGTQVQESGLWDQRVVAKVRAYPVRDPRYSKPVYARFRFTDVRAAVS